MLEMIFLMIATAASSGGNSAIYSTGEAEVASPAIEEAEVAEDVATEAPDVATEAEAEAPDVATEADISAPEVAEDVATEAPSVVAEAEAEAPVVAAEPAEVSPTFLSPSKEDESATASKKAGDRARGTARDTARGEVNNTARDTSGAAATAPVTVFLAPVQDGVSPAAPLPTFLAPAATPPAADATPLFLAPKADVAPVFLAPTTAPGLVAEPQTPTGRFTTATEVKPILEATRANWITVREFDGKDLLYVTHLWSWRCGLLEMRVGINGNPPEVWPLPQCRLDQQSPAAILEEDGLPYAEFGLGALALIEVQITYDDLSTDSAKFNRNGVLVP